MEASAAESVGVLLFLVVLALTLVAILATLATVWFRGVHVHVHLHNHNNMIATGDGSNIAIGRHHGSLDSNPHSAE